MLAFSSARGNLNFFSCIPSGASAGAAPPPNRGGFQKRDTCPSALDPGGIEGGSRRLTTVLTPGASEVCTQTKDTDGLRVSMKVEVAGRASAACGTPRRQAHVRPRRAPRTN